LISGVCLFDLELLNLELFDLELEEIFDIQIVDNSKCIIGIIIQGLIVVRK
jgi:hypothetical protein